MSSPSPVSLYRRLRAALRFLGRPGRRGGRVVQPYRGYGSRREVFLMGRVFRQPGLGLNLSEGPLDDLLNLIRRTVRWGVGDARLRVRVAGAETIVATDRDGYFRVRLPITETLPAGGQWLDARLTLLSERGEPDETSAPIYIPPADVDCGVISDIDDTVIYTGVAGKLTMMYRLFVQKARHRTAFPGVSALYRALFHGAGGDAWRPMLYVSRGPWNIYDVLGEFFHLNRIPHGPVLFLREWGVTLQRPLPRRAREHKAELIDGMLGVYRDLPFLLIGDSGQRDPEVYADIVERHPGRIRAIYIRHMHRHPARDRDIQALADRVAEHGCDMILARDSEEMASHAFANGWIGQSGMDEVRRDCRRREGC